MTLRTVTQVGQGGNVPAGACVITDAMGPLTVRLTDTNALPTDDVAFKFNFPETIAAQGDAVSFTLQFPDTNALPTDNATFTLTATYSDTNVVPDDTVAFTFNFPDMIAGQSETITLQIAGFADTNAGQADDFLLTIATADTNALPSDAATFTLYPTYSDTNDVQSETLDLTISGFDDSNSTPTDAATAEVVYLNTGTFTPPTGITTVIVECWGGGQGGVNGSSTTGGAGGLGADYARSTLTVVPGTAYTVTIGNGGGPSTAGGDSWFNTATTVRAKGGGSANTTIGDVTFTGGAGAAGTLLGVGGGGGGAAGDANNGGAASGQTGGTGGVAGGGDGGNGGASSGNGSPGVVPGGGGGGGGFKLLGSTTAGSGAKGKIMVKWTLA